MSTLYSKQVDASVQARASLGVNVVTGTYALGAALAADDVIEMVKIPAGATIDEITLSATDLDTNGSAAIVLDVGDGSDADRFIDGSTAGQAGGIERINVPTVITEGVITTGIGYKYVAADTIDIKVATGPATGATSGTIALQVIYHMEGFN